MPIFPDPEQTPQDIAKEQVRELNSLAERTIGLAKAFSEKMFNHFWNNSKSTPMEMSEIYGNTAYKLFVKLNIFNQAIKEIDPDYIIPVVPEKYVYVINQDGTVTIIEKVDSSSSSCEIE